MHNVEIPCMVGDKVFVINRHLNRVFECVVIAVRVGCASDNRNHIVTRWTGPRGNQSIRKWKFQQVGKYVFLDKEDAQKALGENPA